MEEIKYFCEHNGNATFYSGIEENVIKEYQGQLPDFLINLWKTQGLCHYRNGFYFFTNPLHYKEIILFFGEKYKNHCVVMRTALGGLFLINLNNKLEKSEKQCLFYCPIRKEITPLTSNFMAVLNGWLTTEEVYYPLTFFSFFEQAYPNLGEIASDECYGFFPAIALGGDLDAKNLQKVKLKEHLLFLSQL